MLPEPIRWSHATGKRVVPSPWQMTAHMISPRATSTESGVVAAAWYTPLRSILNQAADSFGQDTEVCQSPGCRRLAGHHPRRHRAPQPIGGGPHMLSMIRFVTRKSCRGNVIHPPRTSGPHECVPGRSVTVAKLLPPRRPGAQPDRSYFSVIQRKLLTPEVVVGAAGDPLDRAGGSGLRDHRADLYVLDQARGLPGVLLDAVHHADVHVRRRVLPARTAAAVIRTIAWSHVEANVAPNIVDVARRPGAMNVMYRTPWICSR